MDESQRALYSFEAVGLLVVIGFTFLTAMFDGSLPYFPIEISLIANGPLSRGVFTCGIALTVARVLWVASEREDFYAMLWPLCGLLLLALFNDGDHWAMHVLGVAMLLTGIGAYGLWYAWHLRTRLAVAGALYALRLCLKVVVICAFEIDPSLSPLSLVKHPFTYAMHVLTNSSLIVDASCRVMTGEWRNRFWTPLAFKTGGVLQWIVLGICFSVFRI